jgi:DNA-binding transcriptional ArsR family regulator
MVHYSSRLDTGFGAVSDATRRGILERLGRGNASIGELASAFDMTLTGMKKHVKVLEDAELVTTRKVGRTRLCGLGPHRLDDETAWIARYQSMVEERMQRLDAVLEREMKKGDRRR